MSYSYYRRLKYNERKKLLLNILARADTWMTARDVRAKIPSKYDISLNAVSVHLGRLAKYQYVKRKKITYEGGGWGYQYAINSKGWGTLLKLAVGWDRPQRPWQYARESRQLSKENRIFFRRGWKIMKKNFKTLVREGETDFYKKGQGRMKFAELEV